MKRKVKQIAMPLLVLGVVVFTLLVNIFTSDATTPIDDCDRIVESYDLATAEDYINDGKTYTYPACKTEGYLFAGWYTQKTCEEDSYWGKEKPGDTVYALFVPSHVLGVKTQISSNLIDDNKDNDETAEIRFVTTVDSHLYKKVGFDVSYTTGDTKRTVTKSSNKVYKKLYAVGDNTEEYKEDDKVYTPQGSFCALSTYFKACTVKGLSTDLFSMPLYVTPFWITMDGSKVYSDTVIRSVNDYFLEEEVWVSSESANTEEDGTEEKPFKNLDYALGMVRNQGIVHVKDSFIAGSEFVWTDHDKTATITGGTVDFSALPLVTIKEATDTTGAVTAAMLHINDSVTFVDTTLKFVNGQHIYANGNRVEIASDVAWGDTSAYVWIYGGAYRTTLKSDTNLVLGAGNYKRVFGGGNYKEVTGDVNVTISGNVNTGIDYTNHTPTYMAFGGGENGSKVNGDINLTIANDTVLFDYVYGGGYGSEVTGDITVNFSGKSMNVNGGGRNGNVVGNTKLVMSGENAWAEQLFGGCYGANVTGNTNVDVQSGTVRRRVYGGCYNELSDWGVWDTTNFSVTGHTNVAIGPDATLLRNHTVDNGLFAISRNGSVSQNEKGAFIFNDASYKKTYEGKLGSKSGDTYSNKFPTQSYHYLITTNGNAADNSWGTVTSQNDYIRIEPKRGYSATVKVDGNLAYYTETVAAYKLPSFTAEDNPTKGIEVVFSADLSGMDTSNCEARIGNAYYETLEDAINAAKALKSGDATIVTLLKDVDVESTLTISTNVTIQNEAGKSFKVYRGEGLSAAKMFSVTSKGILTINGVGNASSIVLDGRTKEEADANKDRDSVAGSTQSLISNSGTVNLISVTVQYVKKDVTSGDGGVINNATGASLNVKDSLFDNNYTVRYGSVVYSKGDATFENTTFTNNKATGNGGVLCNHGGTYFEVKGCNFNGNSGADGGVIWNDKTATIKNSTFQSNTATGNAGAVQNAGSLTIQNSTFNGNTSAGHGGAIYTQQNTLIENCTFASNTATSNGGAIYCTNYEFTIKYSKFDNNTATINGGAVYNASNAVLTVIGDGTDNSVFMKNKALGTKTIEYDDGTYYGGGAICVGSGTLTVSGYKFTENETKSDGGAINYRGTSTGISTVTVNNCEFISNKALKQKENGLGGAIFIFQGTLNMDVDQSTVTTFEGNQATNGGAIAQGPKAVAVILNNTKFNGNIGDWNGGAIYHKKAVTLTNCHFVSNSTESKGGAICNEGGTLTATTCEFTGNSSVGTGINDHGEGGAYRQAATGTGTFTNCTFSNNTAAWFGGGAIKFNTGSLTIDGCKFSGNTATRGDVYGHDIKMSTTTTLPTIKNSEFDPSGVRDSAGDSFAYKDDGGNKTPYLDGDQSGGNDEDDDIDIVFP